MFIDNDKLRDSMEQLQVMLKDVGPSDPREVIRLTSSVVDCLLPERGTNVLHNRKLVNKKSKTGGNILRQGDVNRGLYSRECMTAKTRAAGVDFSVCEASLTKFNIALPAQRGEEARYFLPRHCLCYS